MKPPRRYTVEEAARFGADTLWVLASDCDDVLRRLAALRAAPPADRSETGWVIERDINSVLHYWTGRVIDGREIGAWSVNHEKGEAMISSEQLQSIEWAIKDEDGGSWCPACASPADIGHKCDCWLARALAAPPADTLDGPRATTALDREYAKALDVINRQREEIDRLKAAPPADALVEAQHRAERAEGRLREISDLLADAGIPGGTTIYGGVMMLRERAEAASSAVPVAEPGPDTVAVPRAEWHALQAEVEKARLTHQRSRP